MENKDLRIEIRPIPNRNKIRNFSENLEYFSQSHSICPFVDSTTLEYATGLSEDDIKYLEKKKCPYDLSAAYISGVAHKFWESQLVKVNLKNSPMFLFPYKNIMDFIKWKYLLVNDCIYTSEEEILSGSKTKATHYIYDVKEEVSLKAAKVERKNKMIQKVSKLSLEKKKEIILILLNELTDNKKDDYVTVRFEDIYSDKILFQKLEELLRQNKEDIKLSAEVKTAIQKNVLTRTRKGIFYLDTNLGFGEEDVISHLKNPENNELYLKIKSKIE